METCFIHTKAKNLLYVFSSLLPPRQKTACTSQMRKTGQLAATRWGKSLRTVRAYFKMISVKLPSVVSGLILMCISAGPRKPADGHTWLKHSVLETLFANWGTRPFRPQTPLDAPSTQKGLLCSNNIIMKSNNSVQAPERNRVCISNKFPQNKSLLMK